MQIRILSAFTFMACYFILALSTSALPAGDRKSGHSGSSIRRSSYTEKENNSNSDSEPSSSSNPNSSSRGAGGGAGAGGVGAGPRPWSPSATYTVTDLHTNTPSAAGSAKQGSPAAPMPPSPTNDKCFSSNTQGSTFAISCNTEGWFVWMECSDGFRYTVGPANGYYRVTMTCPGGKSVERGGTYLQ